jgi:hypothetical protein
VRRTVLVLACLAACKPHPHASPAARDAAAPPAPAIDWAACTQALAARTDGWEAAALHACAPCDLATLLAWQKPAADGGPSRQAINAAMTGCHAFCTGSARERFMATLDAARGVDRAPWRYLGQMCKDQVGASTEAERFMSAPLFALDRMARAVGAHGDKPAAALAAIDLPLPPLTISGTGPTLPPDLGDGIAITPGRLALTVIGTQLYLGRLPHARLDTYGIHVVASGTPYPGDAIKDTDLAAKVAAGTPLPVLALEAAPAAPLADIVAHAPGISLELVVARPPVLGDWMRVAMVPVSLVGAAPAGPALAIVLDGPPPAPPASAPGEVVIELGPNATIAQLAQLLHQLRDLHQVTLRRH